MEATTMYIHLLSASQPGMRKYSPVQQSPPSYPPN
jgi:hypothetical protein